MYNVFFGWCVLQTALFLFENLYSSFRDAIFLMNPTGESPLSLYDHLLAGRMAAELRSVIALQLGDTIGEGAGLHDAQVIIKGVHSAR